MKFMGGIEGKDGVEPVNLQDFGKNKKPDLPPKIDIAVEGGKIGVRKAMGLYSLGRYPIYTTKFDETVGVLDLIEEEEEVTRLYNFILKLLDNFEGKEELTSGVRLIIKNFQQEQSESENPLESCITILLDNSGSMRGRPIAETTCVIHILAEEFEKANIPFEILGFTTKAWKGGESFQKWLKDGKPKNPGRLNDLRHVVYKSYDSEFKKENLGLLMREGLLKENIDGEAMVWAHERITSRPENKKVILHFSDGAPVDDATMSRNKSGLLEEHFTHVLKSLGEEGDLELHLGALHGSEKYGHLYENSVVYTNNAHNTDIDIKSVLNSLTSIFEIQKNDD